MHYNKYKYETTNTNKKLHKRHKSWVIVTTAILGTIGIGTVEANIAHADTISNNQTTETASTGVESTATSSTNSVSNTKVSSSTAPSQSSVVTSVQTAPSSVSALSSETQTVSSSVTNVTAQSSETPTVSISSSTVYTSSNSNQTIKSTVSSACPSSESDAKISSTTTSQVSSTNISYVSNYNQNNLSNRTTRNAQLTNASPTIKSSNASFNTVGTSLSTQLNRSISSTNAQSATSSANSLSTTSSIASSASQGTTSTASHTIDRSTLFNTDSDGNKILNQRELLNLFATDSAAKNRVIKQYNLKSTNDVDLSNELTNRVGIDTSQQNIVFNLVNYNPQTSYGTSIQVDTPNNQAGTQYIMSAKINENATSGISSSYPSFATLGNNNFYLVISNDNNGTSPISGVNSIVLDTTGNGVSNETTYNISNPQATQLTSDVSVNYSMTKDQLYSTSGGIPININDPFWTTTTLSGGTRTYTVFVMNANAAQINTTGNRLITGDSIKYTINTTKNNNNNTEDQHYNIGTFYNTYITPTYKVNYTDLNGNTIAPSQYFDQASSPLIPGDTYTATIPAKSGYVTAGMSVTPYQGTSNDNSTINNDNSITIKGTYNDATGFGGSDVSNVNTVYNIQYVQPTIRNNSKTIQRIIHYVDTNGNQLAPNTVQTVTLNQNAVYDGLTNNLLGYLQANQSLPSNLTYTNMSLDHNATDDSTWMYPNGNQFSQITPLDLTSQQYQTEQTSIAGETVSNTDNNEDVTVVYTKAPTKPADFSASLNRNVTLVDADTGKTINYSSNGYNNGQYNNSVLSTTNIQPVYDDARNITGYSGTSLSLNMDKINAPDLHSLGYGTPDQSTINGIYRTFTQSGSNNQNVTIKYHHTYEVDDAQTTHSTNDTISGTKNHYAQNITSDMLNQNSTWTVHYVSKDNGQTLSPDTSQTLVFKRAAVIDRVTGNLVGYTNNDNPTAQPNQEDPWANSTQSFNAVTAPDLKLAGYINPDPSSLTGLIAKPDTGNLTNTIKYQKAYSVVYPTAAKNAGDRIDGYNAKYQSGATTNDLNHTIQRTIHYVDADNNTMISPDVVQSITYQRAAVVDDTNGQIVGYSALSNPTVVISNSDQAWSTPNTTYAAVDSPNLAANGYKSVNPTTVAAQNTTALDANTTITVNYHHDYIVIPSTESKSTNDTIEGTINHYASNIPTSELNKKVIRTIYYVDKLNGQNIAATYIMPVTFTRSAVVDKVTGQQVGYTTSNDAIASPGQKDPWEYERTHVGDIQTPDLETHGYINADPSVSLGYNVKAYDVDNTSTVKYDHEYSVVEPSNSQLPGTQIPGHTAQYQSGATYDDLNKIIERTIRYKDNTNGQQITDPVIQTVKFKRAAIVDNTDGHVVGYSQMTNPTQLITNSNAAWTSDNAEYPEQASPDMSAYGYTGPDNTTTKSEIVQATDQNTEADVWYGHGITTVTPINYHHAGDRIDSGSVYPSGVDHDDLNHDIIRSINYINSTGQSIIDPTIQIVSYHRNAKIDSVTGRFIGYSDDQGNVINDINQAWITNDNRLSSVLAPDLSNKGYINANPSQIVELITNPDSNDQQLNIQYQDGIMIVNSAHGKTINDLIGNTNLHYPNGVDPNSLNRIITRTIKYQDALGNQLAPTTIQTSHFTRNATVNMVTGNLIGYSDWQSTDNELSGFDVPTITNYQIVSGESVNLVTVHAGDANQNIIITYLKQHSYPTISIDNPNININIPNAPIDNTPQAPTIHHQYGIINGMMSDYSTLPFGITESDVHRRITRTIQYLNDTNTSVAPSVVQTVDFYRNVIVDYATHQIIGYTNGQSINSPINNQWYSNMHQFEQINSPDLINAGYGLADPQTINTENVEPTMADQTVTVRYSTNPGLDDKPIDKLKLGKPNSTHNYPMHTKVTSNSIQPNKTRGKYTLPMSNHGINQLIANLDARPTVTSADTVNQTNNHQTQSANQTETMLPQTGEQDNTFADLLGLIALITSGLYMQLSRKKYFEK